jgi:hypothetical protein
MYQKTTDMQGLDYRYPYSEMSMYPSIGIVVGIGCMTIPSYTLDIDRQSEEIVILWIGGLALIISGILSHYKSY